VILITININQPFRIFILSSGAWQIADLYRQLIALCPSSRGWTLTLWALVRRGKRQNIGGLALPLVRRPLSFVIGLFSWKYLSTGVHRASWLQVNVARAIYFYDTDRSPWNVRSSGDYERIDLRLRWSSWISIWFGVVLVCFGLQCFGLLPRTCVLCALVLFYPPSKPEHLREGLFLGWNDPDRLQQALVELGRDRSLW